MADWFLGRIKPVNMYFIAIPELYSMDTPYSSIKVGEVSVGFHPSDEKAGPGVKGQVAYWLVDDMNKAIEHLLKLGCTVYRGPITSVDSETVAQLIDPFGNALGIIEKKK